MVNIEPALMYFDEAHEKCPPLGNRLNGTGGTVYFRMSIAVEPLMEPCWNRALYGFSKRQRQTGQLWVRDGD